MSGRVTVRFFLYYWHSISNKIKKNRQMKKPKFTPDYLLSIIPDQYNASIDRNDIVISPQNNYLSINSVLITDIEINHVTVKITIKIGKIYNVIALWKNCTHVHNTTFKI